MRRLRWPFLVVLLSLAGCTVCVETRHTAEPLVLDEGAWLPSAAEEAVLFGTHRLAPAFHPEARQVYRWLAMLLLEPDGAFLGFERATFFNGDPIPNDPGYRRRRGTYDLRQRTDGTRAIVLTFARPNDDDPSSRVDLGGATYVVRLENGALSVAHEGSGPLREDAYLPMDRDPFGACATAADCAAQHPGEGARACVVPRNTLGPSFGTCDLAAPARVAASSG